MNLRLNPHISFQVDMVCATNKDDIPYESKFHAMIYSFFFYCDS